VILFIEIFLLAKPTAPRGLLRKASEQLRKPKLEISQAGGGCVKTKNYTFPEDRFTHLRTG